MVDHRIIHELDQFSKDEINQIRLIFLGPEYRGYRVLRKRGLAGSMGPSFGIQDSVDSKCRSTRRETLLKQI